MVAQTATSKKLKTKVEKLENELERVKKQKEQLVQKEKKLQKSIKEAQTDYIISLMAESGKTMEELEAFAQSTSESAEATPHEPVAG